VPSGITFLAPASGKNVACVSVWENFQSSFLFPFPAKRASWPFFSSGHQPHAVRVENGRLEVEYKDGERAAVSLVNPVNFDDWLVSAVQQENETVYFSDFNHGIVQRIQLDPARELRCLECGQ